MKNVIEVFNNYQGNSVILILALLAAIYLLVRYEEKWSKPLITAGALFVILLYNDLIFYLIEGIWGIEMYNSLVYGIPVTLICAVAAVILMLQAADTWTKRGILSVGIIIIGLCAYRIDVTPEFSNMVSRSEDKIYVEMSEAIIEDAKTRRENICNVAYTDSEHINIAADADIYMQIRGLSSKYVMAYDITDTTWADNLLTAEPMIYSMVVGGGQIEHNLMREMLAINCVEYAVIETEREMDEYMGRVGYSALGRYGEYTVYARDNECYPMRIDYWGYVRRVYFYLLGRRGTYEEIYSEIQKIGSQEQTLDEVAYNIIDSEEFRNRNMNAYEAIKAIYWAIYYREPTDAEYYYWGEYMAKGGNYHDMYYELYYNTGEFHIDWE